MANVRSGNTCYVDATGTLETTACRVIGVVVTATAANAVVALTDQTGTVNKLNLRVATSGATQHFDFSQSPLSFPAGVKVTTLTAAIVTVIYN